MANILVIDDEQNILDFLSHRIKTMGHTPVRAANCAEGLLAMDDPTIQVIIADIYLPDSPGPGAWIDQLIARAKNRPVILITGFPSQELTAKLKEITVTALLTKPFELVFLDELIAKITGSQPT